MTIFEVPRGGGKTLAEMAVGKFEPGSTVTTDEHPAYKGLGEMGYGHLAITASMCLQWAFRYRWSAQLQDHRLPSCRTSYQTGWSVWDLTRWWRGVILLIQSPSPRI